MEIWTTILFMDILRIFMIVIKNILVLIFFMGISIRKNKKKVLFYTAIFLLVEGITIFLKPYFFGTGRFFKYFIELETFLMIGCFEGELLKKVRAVTLSYFIVSVVDKVIISFIILMSKNHITYISKNLYYHFIIEAINLIVFSIIFCIFKLKKHQVVSVYLVKTKQFLCVTLGFILADIGIRLMHSMQRKRLSEDETTVLTILLVLFVFIFCIIALMSMRIFYTKEELKKKAEMQEQNFQRLLSYQNTLEETMQEKSKVFHDIKAHLLWLADMYEREEHEKITAYVEQLHKKMEDIPSIIKTGNNTADIIVNDFQRKMKERMIEVICVGIFRKEWEIEDSDLTSLLFNILSNAMEAVEKIEEKCLRKIAIEIRHFQEKEIIICKNPIKKGQKGTTGFETTKKDKKYHGYGIKNIRSIAQKYAGEALFTMQDQMFEVTVILGKSPKQAKEDGASS